MFVVAINALELAGLSLFIPIIDLVQHKTGEHVILTSTLSGVVLAVGLKPVLSTFLFLLSLLFLAKTVLLMWMRYVSVRIASGLQDKFRVELYQALLDAQVAFINDKRQGMLLSVLNEHTVRAGQAFYSFVQSIGQWVTVAVYAWFVFWISWKLTLISIFLGLGVVPALRWIGRQAYRHGKTYTTALENMQHGAYEGLHAKKLVNAMNWSYSLRKYFQIDSEAVRMHWQRFAFWANSPGIIIQPLAVVILSLIIWYSMRFHLSIALLGAFSLAFIRMLPTIQSAISLGADFHANKPSMESVFKLLKEAEDSVEPTGDQRFEGLKNEIRLERVCYRYTSHLSVLANLDLTILRGQTVGLIGPSGSGKTTIADLIMGLFRPESGCILIDGTDLNEIDMHQYRSFIAYIPQEPVLFHDTIRNNLTLGLERKTNDDEIKEACQKAGAWDFILTRQKGLEEVVGDRGIHLSGGQRQRLSLARALLRNPEILILDEATSALDNESEQWIKKMLQDLRSNNQYTIIVIAHRYTTIQFADQIYEIQQGSAVSLGTWEQAKAYLPS